MKKRVKIVFSYDGSHFFGSQIQTNSPVSTVMGTFQGALKSLGIKQVPQASGRTDKGVHALNQVCHLDIPLYFSNLQKLKEALNRHLKPYIFIKKITFTNQEFHARFSAKKRLYRYILSHSTYSPMCSNYTTFTPEPDINSINANIKKFVGTHNFKYFKKEGSDAKSDIRTIYNAFAYRYKNYTVIYFLGDSFLRSQIRLICGFVLEMEKGGLECKDLQSQLNLEKRIYTNPAPASGLYLSRIYY